MAKAWKDAPFKIDTENIAVAGHSCGGIESITNLAGDKKTVKAGVLIDTGGAVTAQGLNFKAPTLWVNGGPIDVVYRPSEAAFKYFAENKPGLPTLKVRGF
jgi:dienelactone hydrolase